jgi:magnesium-transporting ATPase (P-type)
VGDLLFIEEDDQLPADVVILKTSEENGGCYITTANLDGETDFKPRKAVRETMNLSEDVLSRFDGVIECAVPNREIYKFDSRLRMSQYDTKNLPLDNSNTALQATTLKNAKWVIGAVVYTGNQTKIGMNKTTPPTKWTRLDKYINRATLAIFGFQLFLVVLFGIFGNVWRMNYAPSLWYGHY